MSIQAVAWALEQNLPARPKLVLVSIANHANHVDGYCWLKAETIAKEAACTPRSIYNFVGALIRNGFIRKALRRGDDGKQRATDYWILFDREAKQWDQDAHLESDEGDGEASEIATAYTLGTTSGEPDEPRSGGETDATTPEQPVEIPAGSCGPPESGFHHKRFAEPSRTNPKEETGVAVRPGGRPRAYRPPPPQPLGAVLDQPKKPIFVYAGTPAYEAWAKLMAIRNRTRSWSLTTRANINGEWKTGWYFPSLFPPAEPKSTDPPSKESAA